MLTRAMVSAALGLLVTAGAADAQVWVQRCGFDVPHPDCAVVTNGRDGKDGKDGRDGLDGKDAPAWPDYRPGYDFLTGPATLVATVPKSDGHHDKLLYRPGIAALVTRDAEGRRCYQIARSFHADMTFTAVTVDAARTFSWHDATGYWSEPWIERACTVF